MTSAPVQAKPLSLQRLGVAFLVAYVASRAILAAAGFRYALFSDPLDLGKLAIDFGVWILAFGAALLALGWRPR